VNVVMKSWITASGLFPDVESIGQLTAGKLKSPIIHKGVFLCVCVLCY
jgi:hypothetical protein